MDPIARHIAVCNNVVLPGGSNAVLPGGRVRLVVGGQAVGWLDPTLREAVLALGGVRTGDGIAVDGAGLPGMARALAAAGRFRWRDEAFDVRAAADGPVLSTLDRGALPAFGVRAEGVHLNGLVRGAEGLCVWVARRAADKLLDPGKLDHLVAGGVPSGLTPWETLLKEAEEEAGVPAALLAGARRVATIEYAMERGEGLRRDRLHCYDVELPADFVPEARDGEVAGFELWPLPRVLARVRETDDFKFNVNLVLIDLFRRVGMLPPG